MNSVLALALLGSLWGRKLDAAQVSQNDFLRSLALPFKDWSISDAAVDPHDIELLRPDSVLIRRYTSPEGEIAELAVIAGHRKQSVHSPTFCMVGDGWEILSEQAHTLKIAGRSIEATRAIMANAGHRVVATFFYTDGDYSTRNIVRFQMALLMKRFSRQVPIGALVRIVAPIGPSQEEAEDLSDQLAEATLPAVLQSMRSVHLKAQ